MLGNLIGLRREDLILNETSEGFGIAEVFCSGEGWSYTCTQFLFVITTGNTVYLTGLWFWASLSTYSSCNSIQAFGLELLDKVRSSGALCI